MITLPARLGFLGAGQMAQGLARGIQAAGLSEAITAYDPAPDPLKHFCTEIQACRMASTASIWMEWVGSTPSMYIAT